VKKLTAITLSICILSLVTSCGMQTNIDQQESKWKVYCNVAYKISLNYPKAWEFTTVDRCEGEDGFFQICAFSGKDLSIDQVAENDAFHKLKPYGDDPQIMDLEIDEQEARLILPSTDQPKEMQNQAALIVKYPTEIELDNNIYYYLILWADKDHIEQIGQSLTFIDEYSE